MPSMTWVSTFGLTAACGKSPLSDLSTFNDVTGGTIFRFSPSFSPEGVVAGGDVTVVVVLVVLVAVPAVVKAIDEMLTVTAADDAVTAADDADVIDKTLDVVFGPWPIWFD